VTTASEIHTHLLELEAERALGSSDRRSLDEEIEATNRAYVGAAVTEIASFRAELSGPQVG
jgi:hypothetical protein